MMSEKVTYLAQDSDILERQICMNYENTDSNLGDVSRKLSSLLRCVFCTEFHRYWPKSVFISAVSYPLATPYPKIGIKRETTLTRGAIFFIYRQFLRAFSVLQGYS